MQDVETNRDARRRQAARLLEEVLAERLEPRMAINRWPESADDEPDPSLDAALQALWYFEADEERHKQELFYLDAQLELLRQIATCLHAGNDLPIYIQRTYLPQSHQARFYFPRSFQEEARRFFSRPFQAAFRIWRQAVLLNPWLNR